jgi:hypothetical protein
MTGTTRDVWYHDNTSEEEVFAGISRVHFYAMVA